MIIRPAAREDAPAISALNDVVQRIHVDAEPRIFRPPSRESFPEDEIIGLLDNPKNVFLIAIEGERAIGCLFAEIAHRAESSLPHAFGGFHSSDGPRICYHDVREEMNR